MLFENIFNIINLKDQITALNSVVARLGINCRIFKKHSLEGLNEIKIPENIVTEKL